MHTKPPTLDYSPSESPHLPRIEGHLFCRGRMYTTSENAHPIPIIVDSLSRQSTRSHMQLCTIIDVLRFPRLRRPYTYVSKGLSSNFDEELRKGRLDGWVQRTACLDPDNFAQLPRYTAMSAERFFNNPSAPTSTPPVSSLPFMSSYSSQRRPLP